MKLRQVKIVFFKELLETVRDKRTLMVMILGPVLIYPVLILVMFTMTRAQQGKLEQEPSLVVIAGDRLDKALAKRLDDDTLIELVQSHGEADLRKVVRLNRADAAVLITRDVEIPGEKAMQARHLVRVVVIHNAADERSELALDRIRDVIDAYSREMIAAHIAVLDKGEQYAYPLVVSEESVGTPEAMGRRMLAHAIPMVLVLMTIAGSMYPAIDITAGEKERGTIETILTTPAGTAEIVTGKFLTVFVIAVATGLLNLAGMGLSLAAIGSAAQAQINLSLPLDAAFFMLIFILPLAFLFSSVMMAVAMYARTFKEAQNYATPIYLLSVIPAMMSTLPAFELSLAMCLVPVVGVTLLLKELVQGDIVASHLALVFLSTSLYAYIALRITIRLFHNENVLFSSEQPFALFLGRKRLKPRPLPTPGEAMFLTAVCFVLFFLIGQAIQGLGFRAATTLTLWGLVFLPAAVFAHYLRLDLSETFRLRPKSDLKALVGLAGGLIAGAAAVIVAFDLQFLWSFFAPPIDALAEQSSDPLSGLSPVELIVFIAVFPAICEELLFRGFILSGLSASTVRWRAAIVVGLLFGLFHIGQLIINIIPVTQIVLGVVLGLLVAYSDSIYSGMVCHLTFNAGMVLFAVFPDDARELFERMGAAGPWLEGKGHVPFGLLAIAALILTGAVAGVMALGRKRPHP
ncbi:MAG: CPBP family intramembrane metalloprotease [Verrucomicrobia bacterium]|nr:CPBP family intramembrane metalloprotease [Verrucomicrobiota bacterium]